MTIIVVGDLNADLSAAVERFPAEGGDSVVSGLGWSSGGSAANVAAALGVLGSRCRLLARVGDDPAASVALRAARAAGADLSAVQVDPDIATGLCYTAVTPSGERTFFSFRGANQALAAPAPGLLDGARWLHISAYALLAGQQRATTLELIGAAHRRGLPVSVDLCLPALHSWREQIADLLPQLAILFTNEHELAELCPGEPQERAAQLLIKRGVPLVALKLGPHGCMLASAGAPVRLPACEVAAVDSSGCGDAFVAGFLSAHLRGAPLEACLMLANALGALTATRYGAAEALPQPHKLREFLQQPGYAAAAACLEAQSKP